MIQAEYSGRSTTPFSPRGLLYAMLLFLGIMMAVGVAALQPLAREMENACVRNAAQYLAIRAALMEQSFTHLNRLATDVESCFQCPPAGGPTGDKASGPAEIAAQCRERFSDLLARNHSLQGITVFDLQGNPLIQSGKSVSPDLWPQPERAVEAPTFLATGDMATQSIVAVVFPVPTPDETPLGAAMLQLQVPALANIVMTEAEFDGTVSLRRKPSPTEANASTKRSDDETSDKTPLVAAAEDWTIARADIGKSGWELVMTPAHNPWQPPFNDHIQTIQGLFGAVVFLAGLLLFLFIRPLIGKLVLSVDQLQMLIRRRTDEFSRELEERTASEETFRRIVENYPGVLWVGDGMRFHFVSEGYTRLTGLRRETLHRDRRAFMDAVHPDDRGILNSAHPPFQNPNETPSDREIRMLGPDGKVRWLRMTEIPMTVEGRRAGLLLGILDDITDQRAREGRLHKEKAALEAMLDASPLGVFQAKASGEIIAANPMAAALFGYASPDQWIETANPEGIRGHCVVPFTWEHFVSALALSETPRERPPRHFDARCRRFDGEEFDAMLHIQRLPHSSNGNGPNYVGFISERENGRRDDKGLPEMETDASVIPRASFDRIVGDEAPFKSLFDISPIGILKFSSDGGLTDANPAAAEILGFENAESLTAFTRKQGPGAPSKLTAEEGDDVFGFAKALSADRRRARLRRADGTPFDALIYRLPIETPDGHRSAYILFEDIGRLQKADEEKNARRRGNIRLRKFLSEMLTGFGLYEVIQNDAGIPVDLRILEVNSELAALTALTPDDMTGKTFRELFPGAESLWVKRLGEVALTGESTRFCARLSPLNKHLEISACQTEPGRGAAAFTDVTDKIEAEKQLRVSRFAMDNADLLIFILRPDGRFDYVNDAACRRLGYRREELMKRTMPELDRHLTGKEYSDLWNILARDSVFNFESELITRPGALIPVEVSINYLNMDGEAYNCAFIRDITERRTAETRLKQAHEQFSMFMDQLPGCTFIQEAGGKIVYANSSMKLIFGLSGQESVEENPSLAALINAIQPDVHQVLETGRSHFQEQTVRIEGVERTLRITLFPLSQEGNPPLVGGVAL